MRQIREARLLLILLPGLMLCGCADGEEKSIRILRTSVTRNLEQSQRLMFLGVSYIPDGGSAIFHFATDAGTRLFIQALHRDPRMGGNAKYQEFRFSTSPEGPEFELSPGSNTEKQLLRLLKGGHLLKESGAAMEPPTPERLAWFSSRVANRSLAWTTLP